MKITKDTKAWTVNFTNFVLSESSVVKTGFHGGL